MSTERIGNIGYAALVKQTDPNVVLTPTTYVPLYEESLSTNANFQSQQPAYGGKFATWDTLRGQRGHTGELTTLAEPNTTAKFIDMLYTKESTTGADPYTHVFGLSATVNPSSYVLDISTGNVVKRFWGVGASSISPDWSDNELRHKIKVSALGSFQGRSIATVATTTLTLDTKYDPAPNKGLVVGDLVRIFKESTGATLDTTIASVNVDGVTVTLGASAAAFAAGDIIHLRPATQSFTVLPTFLWAKTEFRFGATAAAALSATQVRVEQGSAYEIMHDFEDEEGAKRSGGFDPAALVRMTGDSSTSIKKFFDTPEEVQDYNDMTKNALVIRHFAGDTNQYEYRITFHRLTTDTPVANVTANDVNYATLVYRPNYDATDGRAMTITVINSTATV